MSGCYVYFTNKETEKFFRSRMALQADTPSVETAPLLPEIHRGKEMPQFYPFVPKIFSDPGQEKFVSLVPLYSLEVAVRIIWRTGYRRLPRLGQGTARHQNQSAVLCGEGCRKIDGTENQRWVVLSLHFRGDRFKGRKNRIGPIQIFRTPKLAAAIQLRNTNQKKSSTRMVVGSTQAFNCCH